MKKILGIILILLVLTGCTAFDIETMSIDKIIDTTLSKDVRLKNNIYEGYNIYVPRGLKIIDKNDYNLMILDENETFYLYVDIVSYFYKNKTKFSSDSNSGKKYFSKSIKYNSKRGYVDITEIDDKYLIEYLYNYSKMEALIEKENLNRVILNMTYILSSIDYNDKVIETLMGEDVLSYKEEKVDLFESNKGNNNFLEALEKYEKYESDDEDQDILEFEEIE